MSETNEDKNKKERSYIPALIFYPFTIVFFELALKFMDDYNSPWNISLPVTILFSVSFGLLLAFLFTLIRPVLLSRILSGVTLLLIWLVFCVEYDCNQFYKMYYGITYAVSMTGQVMGDFSSVVWEVAREYAVEEAFFAIPIILYIGAFAIILPKRKYPKKLIPIALIPFLILQTITSIFCRFS
jgi:hypothetical protein